MRVHESRLFAGPMHVVTVILSGLYIAAVGCFPPAIEKGSVLDSDSDGLDALDGAEEVLDSDTRDSLPELSENDGDLLDSLDTADTTDTSDVPDSDDDEVATVHCSVDIDCQAVGSPPCVVGRCIDGTCRTANVSVPCDDSDWCTVADECKNGVCVGRAFEPAETGNWAFRIAGAGDFTVIDHVVHPSGEATLVGSFQGELNVPGRSSLSSEGGFDGFLLRFHPSGAVVQALSWGGPNHETPIGVAVDGEDVLVAWGQRAFDFSGVASFRSVRVSRGHSVLNNSVPIHGRPHGFDAMPTGQVLVVALIEAEVQIPISNGGVTVLSPQAGADAYVAAFSNGVARWLQPISGLDVEAVHHVLSLEQNFAVLTLEPGAKIGNVEIVPASASSKQVWAVGLDSTTGAVGERAHLGDGWEYAFSSARFERSYAAFMTSSRHEAAMLLGLHVGPDPTSPECSRTVTLSSGDGIYSSVVPSETGAAVAMLVSGGSAVDLGAGVSLASGPHTLGLAVYNQACVPHRVTPLGFDLADAHPAAVHRAGAILGASSKVRAGRNGRVYLSGPLRSVTTPGPMFPGVVLVPEDEYEAFFASVGPKDLLGCGTSGLFKL